MALSAIPEYIDGLPNICGSEELISNALNDSKPIYLHQSGIDFEKINSCFAIALHMHQPLIPAGGDNLQTASVISNLKFMFDHRDIGDNHNAPIFHWCYKRIGEFIPRLVKDGKQPRVMLDYSGCLLHGLRQMGLHDVINSLKKITCEPAYRRCVEWLGSAWGHPVAPSTPVQDYRLHVRAWQHFFAALFGFEALSRVRGFSPSEMALPNHPDVCYEFVKILKECGYRWVLVQEHTVEMIEDGGPITNPHVPHQLVAKNSQGQVLTITAIIKTQGSDTKLVGQMQPYYEAKGLSRTQLAPDAVPANQKAEDRNQKTDYLSSVVRPQTSFLIPPIVTQIADGENGGVMMNEFPSKYMEVSAECSGTQTPAVNVTEYLEYLQGLGIKEEDLPPIQPIMQKRIWDRFKPARQAGGNGNGAAEALTKIIEKMRKEDPHFNMEGGSWTNNVSWVRGYEQLLGPMESASALFAEKVLNGGISASDPRYRNALYHLLMTQTSCFRYWGSGIWTDYGRELCRRTMEILKHNF
jgi:hypothetical protein